MYEIDIVDYPTDFEKLRSQWNSILGTARVFSPFACHEWLDYSYRAEFSHSVPLILRVKKKNTTIGFLPLSLFRSKIRNISFQTLGFPDNPDAFVNQFICTEPFEEILPYLLHFLANKFDRWETVYFKKVKVRLSFEERFKAWTREFRMKSYVVGINDNLYLTINQPWDVYYGARTRNFRKSNRGVQNRLKRQGDICVEHKSSESEALDRSYKELMQISENSWKKELGVSLSQQAASRRFFEYLIKDGLPGCSLIISLLRMNGVAIASEFHIRNDKIEYALRADYHQGYQQHSPGNYLDFHITKHLFEEGLERYELGPGLNPYKLKWTESMYRTIDVLFVNRNLKGFILSQIENGFRKASQIKHTLSPNLPRKATLDSK